MREVTSALRFGDFTFDPANRQLLRGGEVIELGSRYFDALALLIANPQALVSKDRFLEVVWKGIPVTDEALTQCIRTLRRALGDDAANPRFIETVPKHGYRFLAEVAEIGDTRTLPAVSGVPARIAGATTLGGLVAGLIGGGAYGLLCTNGDAAGTATIILLTAALALIGGAGIGTGMALASLWRGERDWSVVLGGAAGGVVTGALGSALASHGMEALTGTAPGRVTGTFEGLALGVAASVAVTFARRSELARWKVVGIAVIVGATTAGLTALAGGRFYAATLKQLERAFPASHIDMDPLISIAGPVGTATAEGAIFAAVIVLANLVARTRRQ